MAKCYICDALKALPDGCALGLDGRFDYACDVCGYPGSLHVVGAIHIDYVLLRDWMLHVFRVPPYTCAGCGNEYVYTKVYCGGPLDVTAEFSVKRADIPLRP